MEVVGAGDAELLVGDLRARLDDDPPPGSPESTPQVRVLEIEEVPLVEAAHRFQRLAPHQQAAPVQPIDRVRLGREDLAMVPGGEAPGLHVAAGADQAPRPLAVDDDRADHPDARIAVCDVVEAAQRVRRHAHVVREQQRQLAAFSRQVPEPRVHPRGVASVLPGPDHSLGPENRRRSLGAGVRRVVVDHVDDRGDPLRALHRLDARREGVASVPVQDVDVEPRLTGAHRRSPPDARRPPPS